MLQLVEKMQERVLILSSGTGGAPSRDEVFLRKLLAGPKTPDLRRCVCPGLEGTTSALDNLRDAPKKVLS